MLNNIHRQINHQVSSVEDDSSHERNKVNQRYELTFEEKIPCSRQHFPPKSFAINFQIKSQQKTTSATAITR